MKKFKKFLLVFLVLGIIGGAIAGGIYAYQKHQEDSLEAKVVYVSDLNYGFYEDEMTSSGYVSNDLIQNIYVEDRKIAEVKVKEGSKVKKGDVLLVYDTSEQQMQIELKELELKGVETDITQAKNEIARLKKITPVSETAEKEEEEKETEKEEEETEEEDNDTVILMQPQRKTNNAYNYIDKKAEPYACEGTMAKPFRFVCNQGCYVLGEYLNQLIEKEQIAAFEIWTGNSVKEGTLLNYWTFDGTAESKVEADSKWLVITKEQIEEEEVIEEDTEEEEEEEEETEEEDTEEESDEETYTKEELNDAIAEEEDSLTELEMTKRELEVELESLKKTQEKANVTANIDGVVKSVGDPESPSLEGTPFIEITDAEGLYVTGEISELRLDQIAVGQEIYVNSWSNGEVYTAEITEISKYPSENSEGYYGEGNMNVSFYPFTAYIEDSDGLTNGDYVDISITPMSMEEDMNGIYIEKAYVREENGQAYVYKADENEKLVKQYVQTGRTIYGSAIEIKAGLSEDDRIAFPYGKTAKEGVKVVESTDLEFY
ncbi:MAG: HlyD family efflux transporter periplasmic adaptor subunit [Lachnospiraceae bacterium]|nr:HlyD family efflux transporter periplasmic adaptor subunit [Lachnospiraceae bacterium]